MIWTCCLSFLPFHPSTELSASVVFLCHFVIASMNKSSSITVTGLFETFLWQQLKECLRAGVCAKRTESHHADDGGPSDWTRQTNLTRAIDSSGGSSRGLAQLFCRHSPKRGTLTATQHSEEQDLINCPVMLITPEPLLPHNHSRSPACYGCSTKKEQEPRTPRKAAGVG